MTTEDKELLLQDLCSRLPYGVKVYGNYSYSDGDQIIDDIQIKVLDIYDIDWIINNIEIKPYLFPLSSITEKQKIKLIYGIDSNYAEIDWYNKNHFDYRGLIGKGLAIDCSNLNIY